MFLGMGGPDRNLNCEDCWGQLVAGFKFFFVSSLLVTALGMLLGFLPLLLICTFDKVVFGLQLWRLLFSFWVNGTGIMGILMVLINCYILYSCMPEVVNSPLSRKSASLPPTSSSTSSCRPSSAT